MKIRENVTVYKCEFCNRNMFVKRAMELHEKWCYKNPDNQKACSCCIHLEEVEVKYKRTIENPDYPYPSPYYETRKTKGFRCKQLDKMLYPLKVEKKGLPQKFPETFENQEPMPTHCEFSQPF